MSRLHRRVALAGSAVSAQLAQWTQRGFIKSIQTGTANIATGTTTGTSTLPIPVTPENSILFYLGATIAAFSTNPGGYARLTLTSSTVITANTAGGVAQTTFVGWVLVEFMPGVIRSVQRGTIVLAATATKTATITAVVPAKAWPVWVGYTFNSGGNNDLQFMPKLVLTDATTVTASTGNAPGPAGVLDITVGYQIVEFY